MAWKDRHNSQKPPGMTLTAVTLECTKNPHPLHLVAMLCNKFINSLPGWAACLKVEQVTIDSSTYIQHDASMSATLHCIMYPHWFHALLINVVKAPKDSLQTAVVQICSSSTASNFRHTLAARLQAISATQNLSCILQGCILQGCIHSRGEGCLSLHGCSVAHLHNSCPVCGPPEGEKGW